MVLRACLDDTKREMALKANQEELTKLATHIHTKYARVGITAEELGLPPSYNNSNSVKHPQAATTGGQSGKDDIELMLTDDTDDAALPRPRSSAGVTDGRPSSSHSIKMRRIRSMIKQAQSHVATKLAQDMKLNTANDRLKYLQSLLNQEKVVKLLYDRTFPFQTYNYNNSNNNNNNNNSPANKIQEDNNYPADNNNNDFFNDYNTTNTTTTSLNQHKGGLLQDTDAYADTADFAKLQLDEQQHPMTAAMSEGERALHSQTRPFTDSL